METHWTPENPEEEPFASLTFPDGKRFEVNRQNSTLFTYLGRLAVYNHVYICQVEEEEVTFATHIFRHVEGYEPLARYMLEQCFPAFLNQTVVLASDVRAFDKAVDLISRLEDDHIPDSWET